MQTSEHPQFTDDNLSLETPRIDKLETKVSSEYEYEQDICAISDCGRYAMNVCKHCYNEFVCVRHLKDRCSNCSQLAQQYKKSLKKKIERDMVKEEEYKKTFPISNLLFKDRIVIIWGLLCFIVAMITICSFINLPLGDDGISGAIILPTIFGVLFLSPLLCLTPRRIGLESH